MGPVHFGLLLCLALIRAENGEDSGVDRQGKLFSLIGRSNTDFTELKSELEEIKNAFQNLKTTIEYEVMNLKNAEKRMQAMLHMTMLNRNAIAAQLKDRGPTISAVEVPGDEQKPKNRQKFTANKRRTGEAGKTGSASRKKHPAKGNPGMSNFPTSVEEVFVQGGKIINHVPVSTQKLRPQALSSTKSDTPSVLADKVSAKRGTLSQLSNRVSEDLYKNRISLTHPALLLNAPQTRIEPGSEKARQKEDVILRARTNAELEPSDREIANVIKHKPGTININVSSKTFTIADVFKSIFSFVKSIFSGKKRS